MKDSKEISFFKLILNDSKWYFCDNLDVVTIYCKMEMYFWNDLSNCKTWWIIYSYIEYKLIVPVQLQLKSLIHVISQKTSR